MNSRINPTHTGAATLLSGEQVVDSSRKGARRKFWSSIAAGSLPLRLLYSIYERHLVREIERRPMPRHVGIILDGNRRHARQQGVCDTRAIYQRGAEKLDDVLDWCAELSIPAVTLWVFSTENFKRSPSEVSGILAAIEAKVATLAHDPFLHRKRVRVQTIGRLDVLPESVAAAFRARSNSDRRIRFDDIDDCSSIWRS
jgi:short-chain Z-isoprenyl diphosphate synthase